MTGVGVELDARDLAEFSAALVAAAGASLAPLMDAMAGVGEEATIGRIHAGGPAPDGTAWAPRHPAYRNPHPLLNREGGLVDSIEGEGDADSAVWGSPLVYARVHQLGATIVPRESVALHFRLGGADVYARSVTIPQRQYLGWGADERRGAGDVVEAWLERTLGGD